MNFKVKIDNIGKLKGASLFFRPLTVLAGPNSSGKSFVSKTLYSVFRSFGGEPTWAYMRHKLEPLMRGREDLARAAENLNMEIIDIKLERQEQELPEYIEVEGLERKAEEVKTHEENFELARKRKHLSKQIQEKLKETEREDKIISRNENLVKKLQPKAQKISADIENLKLLCSDFDKMPALGPHAFPERASDLFRLAHKEAPLDGGALSDESNSESANTEAKNPEQKKESAHSLSDSFDQKLDKILKQLIKSSLDCLELFNHLAFSLGYGEISDSFAKENPFSQDIRPVIHSGARNIKQGVKILKQIKSGDFARFQREGISLILKSSFIENFQAPVLRELKGDTEKEAHISFEKAAGGKKSSDNFSICKISLKAERIQSDFSSAGLAELQAKSGAIFIESPFYWKLKEPLLRAGERLSYLRFSGRKSLLIPKHFIDLAARLRDSLSGEMAFPEIFEEITQKIIKGKIIIDVSGNLYFKEFGGKRHSLPLTAAGIAPLGLLALLIEKKALDKGTVLFIDEPETSLHPAWQMEMMKILFRLAKAGAFVVIATHSIDMLKWLEERLEERPEDKKLIALNQLALQEDGSASSVEPAKNMREQIRLIKKDLAKPFLKLFLEGAKSENRDTGDSRRS